MTRKIIAAIGFMCVGIGGTAPARAQALEAAPSAIIQAGESGHWGAGMAGGWDRLHLRAAGEPIRLDLRRLRVRLNAYVFPGTDFWLEGGGANVEVRHEEPDLATEWAAGVDLYLVEHVLRESPVTGRREWIGLNLTGSYRETRADREKNEPRIRWREWRGGVIARYSQRENPEEAFRSFSGIGYAIRAGLVKTERRGRYGSARLTNPDGLGFLAGADYLWASGWVTRMETLFLKSSSREFMLSVSRFF